MGEAAARGDLHLFRPLQIARAVSLGPVVGATVAADPLDIARRGPSFRADRHAAAAAKAVAAGCQAVADGDPLVEDKALTLETALGLGHQGSGQAAQKIACCAVAGGFCRVQAGPQVTQPRELGDGQGFLAGTLERADLSADRLVQMMVGRDISGFYKKEHAPYDPGNVVLSVPHFLMAMSVLASTDLVAMLPSRLVRGNPALQVVDAPLEVPGYEMAMFWGERSHRDPAHKWLREHLLVSV